MISRKAITGLLALLILVLAIIIVSRIPLNYSISSRGILYPGLEWTLSRTADGNLINSLRDNYNNSISTYTVTEFQRGDLARFIISPELFERDLIRKGDTIGQISSQNEIRRKIELMGELQRQKMLLSVYATGERIEEVNVAYEKMILARQAYEIQQRITERNRVLFQRSHIPLEEYEISEAEYQRTWQSYQIAQSEHQALLSGAKSEQLDYIRANIAALEQQIAHIEEMINGFTITSPISGMIIRQHGVNGINETIVRVAEANQYILIVPVDIYHLPWLHIGQEVNFQSPAGRIVYQGKISRFDNSAQLLDGRQKIFVTARVEAPEGDHSFYPNTLVEVRIPSSPLTLREYIMRLINEVYHN